MFGSPCLLTLEVQLREQRCTWCLALVLSIAPLAFWFTLRGWNAQNMNATCLRVCQSWVFEVDADVAFAFGRAVRFIAFEHRNVATTGTVAPITVDKTQLLLHACLAEASVA